MPLQFGVQFLKHLTIKSCYLVSYLGKLFETSRLEYTSKQSTSNTAELNIHFLMDSSHNTRYKKMITDRGKILFIGILHL